MEPSNTSGSDDRSQHVLPIACALDYAQLLERGEMLTKLARGALVGHKRSADAIELRFRRERSVRLELQHFIELESHCCAFLEFSLEENSCELVLRVTGPHSAEHVLSTLYETARETLRPV